MLDDGLCVCVCVSHTDVLEEQMRIVCFRWKMEVDQFCMIVGFQ